MITPMEHRHLWLNEANKLAKRIAETDKNNVLPILCETCRHQIMVILASQKSTKNELEYYENSLKDDARQYEMGKRGLYLMMPYSRQEAEVLIQVLEEFKKRGLPKTDKEKRMAATKFIRKPVISLARIDFAMDFFSHYDHKPFEKKCLPKINAMLMTLNGILGRFPVIGDEEFLEQYRNTV